MSKFGPSGSFKNRNSTLELTTDVMARSNNEVFLDLKNILAIALSLTPGDA